MSVVLICCFDLRFKRRRAVVSTAMALHLFDNSLIGQVYRMRMIPIVFDALRIPDWTDLHITKLSWCWPSDQSPRYQKVCEANRDQVFKHGDVDVLHLETTRQSRAGLVTAEGPNQGSDSAQQRSGYQGLAGRRA